MKLFESSELTNITYSSQGDTKLCGTENTVENETQACSHGLLFIVYINRHDYTANVPTKTCLSTRTVLPELCL
jgi:hypothetical protein